MAIGSILWGAVAARIGIPVALLLAALGLVIGLTAAARYQLQIVQLNSALGLFISASPRQLFLISFTLIHRRQGSHYEQ